MNKQLLTRLIQWTTIVVLTPAACADDTGPKQPESISVAELCDTPSRYIGRKSLVKGLFKGWQSEACRLCPLASPSVTRSDWLLMSDSVCLYVTGDFPPGLDPMEPQSIDQQLEFWVDLRQKPDGKIYLKYISGR